MTLICHSKKFIFLKTRKTGGTTLEMALQGFCAPGRDLPERVGYVETEQGVIGTRAYDGVEAPVYEHMPARKVRAHVGPEIWNSYTKVSVVRNPYEKLVSEFYWQVREARAMSEPEQIGAFRAWLKSDVRKWTLEDRNIVAINSRLVVQQVVRHERFAEDVVLLGQALDLGDLELVDFKKGIRPRKIEIIHYYDREAVNYVRRNFAFELSAFGYGLEDLFPRM
ncbi:MAG: hypothetical protein AB7S99_00055 [Pseudodonghicola sp.]